jgi:tetratricopeptide (TPR) repeat protein
VDLDPTDDDACLLLARTHTRLGEHEKERDTYLATIRRRPHCWQPYWWLATWYYREGNVDEAMRTYREMIRRAPDLHTGYSSLGGMLVLRGEYGRAIDTLKKAVELRPTKIAFGNLGVAYFNTGRFAEAVDAFNQSFQFGDADYQNWLNLGDAYYWLRDRKDQAAQSYAQAVRMGRDEIATRAKEGRTRDVMIEAGLASMFPKLGQPDSARIYIARAVAADSANPMIQYYAALTLWQLHEKSRALAWLERAVKGGYPVTWLRDSPVFHEWREVPEFRALVGEASPASPPAATQKRGG